MASQRTKRRNSLDRETDQLTEGSNGVRFIDIGVTLVPVEQDLEEGAEALRGAPPLRRAGDPVDIGGRWDFSLQRLIPLSECPEAAEGFRVWYVGKRQLEILLERDPQKTRTLLYSAEGVGKSYLMAQWIVLQVILLALAGEPGAVGATAPTGDRVKTFLKAVRAQIPTDNSKLRRPGAWATWYESDRELRFITGHIIQFRQTKAQSGGADPIQGYTWKASADDELQDSVLNMGGNDESIEARLRGAKTSRRMATATAADNPTWRSFRDQKLSSPNWVKYSLPYHSTPFVWPDHWRRMQQECTPRGWQRRALAMDVGPERMLYHTWQRDSDKTRAGNLVPVPRIGAVDVTYRELNGYHALVGHDPGKLFDVSLLIKCYEVQGKRKWWVVDEFTTEHTTIDQHIAQFKAHLQGKWNLQNPEPDEPKVLVRADPYSDSSDNRPDKGVYLAWKHAGFKALSAAYNKQGLGKGVVPKEARIEMVCRLLCNAAGETTLHIACDDRKQPCAPRLIESLEMSERDEAGKAETQKKNKRDLSHWPAALGYALWPYEKLKDVTRVREAFY